jgi:hexosaminidase
MKKPGLVGSSRSGLRARTAFFGAHKTPDKTEDAMPARAASRKTPVAEIRALHLDFKGTPPTFKRLLRLIDLADASLYNALLVEWEDMFPWTVRRGWRSETAYSERQVERFHDKAAAHGIEIIPLVQCLGHIETALSLDEDRRLREMPFRSDGLNPLAPGARELIEAMIDDVLRLTPDVRYFHLGGDEARTLGRAPETKRYAKEHGKGALYRQHVEPILEKLAGLGIRPILWSDMMAEWPAGDVRKIAKKADLCPWGYHDHPDTFQFHSGKKYVDRFASLGVTLWGAAAYKGATADNNDLCDFDQQTRNAEGWAEVALRHGMKGLIATAWSRFSTHRTQCEPIDACLDSMVNVGFCLYSGKSPGRKRCLEILGEMGEIKRFEKCSSAMADLASARAWAWKTIQFLREQIVQETAEPKRRKSGIGTEYLMRLRRYVANAETAATAAQRAFKGLMQQPWIDCYLRDRVEPLREELAGIDARMRVLEPEQYEAARTLDRWNLDHH